MSAGVRRRDCARPARRRLVLPRPGAVAGPTQEARTLTWRGRAGCAEMRPVHRRRLSQLHRRRGRGAVHETYGAEKYARLVALKDQYDPGNMFHLNPNIASSAARRVPIAAAERARAPERGGASRRPLRQARSARRSGRVADRLLRPRARRSGRGGVLELLLRAEQRVEHLLPQVLAHAPAPHRADDEEQQAPALAPFFFLAPRRVSAASRSELAASFSSLCVFLSSRIAFVGPLPFDARVRLAGRVVRGPQVVAKLVVVDHALHVLGCCARRLSGAEGARPAFAAFFFFDAMALLGSACLRASIPGDKLRGNPSRHRRRGAIGTPAPGARLAASARAQDRAAFGRSSACVEHLRDRVDEDELDGLEQVRRGSRRGRARSASGR